ncbi:hypothetical protein SFUMM280S_09659 [Streptomyces fumanus]
MPSTALVTLLSGPHVLERSRPRGSVVFVVRQRASTVFSVFLPRGSVIRTTPSPSLPGCGRM